MAAIFPEFGRAFIEALCQFYHLYEGDESTARRELQRVVDLVLNNELPRDLQYLNKCARTVNELYVSSCGRDDA